MSLPTTSDRPIDPTKPGASLSSIKQQAPSRITSARLDDITRKNVELIAAMDKASEDHRTFGERTADLIASCVGSWTFLIVQSILFLAWITINLIGWLNRWDPYPFVLLNLVLSFQAAYATPILLMSQNRQGRLSERRNHLDLQINLLAEQEATEQMRLLRLLCQKCGVNFDSQEEAPFEENTQPDTIVRQLTNNVDGLDAQNGSEPAGPPDDTPRARVPRR